MAPLPALRLFLGLLAVVASSKGSLLPPHRTTNLALRGGSSLGLPSPNAMSDSGSDADAKSNWPALESNPEVLTDFIR